jgi:hypothetical protein
VCFFAKNKIKVIFIMNLNITESDKKRVTFEYEYEGEADNDDEYDQVGYIEGNKFTSYEDTPKVGSFQTVQNQKGKEPEQIPSSSRINAPLDASLFSRSSAPAQPIKKKQISYDDILGSMNMRVGPDGKLQMYSQKLQDKFAEQQMRQQLQQPTQRQQQQQPNRPEFFEPQPLTRKQYKQMVALDLIRRQQEQQRLNQIKSTKLLFPNPNVRITTAPTQGANLNRLFRLK